ncbi:MAG TPA: ATP-binding protein [Ignavibacteriaceae bacterium]|nr:ATP-binding protein [Ignavibacteriaceae bacterium]
MLENHSVKILIVEDELIVANDVALTLKKNGYEVVGISPSGESAIQKAKDHQPDVILVDIKLKGKMNGIEAVEKIKTFLDVPIIYLTANSDKETFENAKITSPLAFLIKPINFNELYTTIEVALFKHKMDKQLRESEKWLSTILNTIHDAVLASDKDGKIKYINPTAHKIAGFTLANTQDSTIFDVFQIYDEKTNAHLVKYLYDALSFSKETIFTRNVVLKLQHKEIPVQGRISPILDAQLNVMGMVIVFQDMTQKRLEEKLLQESTEKSEKLKSIFISQISHEVRTPLNNILTYTSLLKDEFNNELPKGLENSFDVIANSSNRLIRTIDLLLSMSKIQTGNFEINNVLTDIDKDILEPLSFDFYPKAKNKDIKFTYCNKAINSKIIGDVESINQIFINLIDNAIKYTQEGFINIEVFNDMNNFVNIHIKDSGIGIPEEYIPDLFIPFSKNISDNNMQGTGLGLALVKNFVDLNNGKISVSSKLNEGTEFIISFNVVNETSPD